jgi:hypothetical protein
MFLGLLVAVLSSCFSTQENTVDYVLDSIEEVDIKTITSNITYTRTDPILNRREIRTGRLLFRMDEDNQRDAAILFDTLIIGRRKEEKLKHYVFSGRWMAEVDYENKQFLKRELISPEENKTVDPFELGNGPVPLPIGQTKESVLKKFNVTIIERPDEGQLSKLDENVVGLLLIPTKQKSNWESIELFYNPETWLPVGVRTIEDDGTKRVSQLTDVKLNILNEEDAKLLSISTPDPKEWSIDIRPWSNN